VELLLMALGGCTGMDIESLVNKMRTPVDDFRIEIEGERVDEHPKVFTRIEIVYKFWGKNLNEDNIKKAVELSHTRYCTVSAILKKTCDISYRIEINSD
ncbi:MAG: OsmC family protein, partial [Candidatus Heimdallarchaeaceae archaeon]